MEAKALSRIALAAMAAAAAASLAHAIWVGSVTDDAGISLAYARNLAAGEGLRLTPLSPRVEAYSDPLWVLWLAAGYALGIGGPGFAKWSGAVCAAAAVFLIGLVPSRTEARAPRLVDAAAPGLLALDTTYNFWAGAGLESGAFALALALLLLLLARRSPWSALPAGLLGVLRPEGPLYVAAFAAVLVAQAARRRGAAGSSPAASSESFPAAWPESSPAASGVGGDLSHRSDLARWLALAALPSLLWLAFRRSYYGEWLPNAYYAKLRWNFGGLRYLSDWFLHDPWHWALLLAPLALLARSTRRAALPAAAACLAAAAFILYSRGDWMSEHRFAAHALPAAALAAGLVPAALGDLLRSRVAPVSALALVAAAAFSARTRSPGLRAHPPLPLSYVAEQGRWFRAAADRLGLTRPRIAHFDIGGLALESGGEVIDLAGLADSYIGRVGVDSHAAVRDYLFEEVKPEMINIHGPCQYLRDDPRLAVGYQLAASGRWGENWVRRSLETDGVDERCPAQGPEWVRRLAKEGGLLPALEKAAPAEVRDLWLCARSHLAAAELPDPALLARRLADQGMREAGPARARDLLDAALTLDPSQPSAARRLLALRLERARGPSRR